MRYSKRVSCMTGQIVELLLIFLARKKFIAFTHEWIIYKWALFSNSKHILDNDDDGQAAFVYFSSLLN